MSSDRFRVLTVGHCLADHAALARALERDFSAQVDAAENAAEARERLRETRYDLVAVNRQFEFGGDGIEFIRQLKSTSEGQEVPVMLVSNFAWAQAEAEALGALPGFGKNDLGSEAMRRAVARARKNTPSAE